jgi:hypothetical protein
MLIMLSTFKDCKGPAGNYCDNRPLYLKHKSPAQAIAAIDSISEADDEYNWAKLFNLMTLHNEDEFLWELFQEAYGMGIVYCLRRGCTTADDAIGWTDLASSFIKGAMRCKDTPTMLKYPVNQQGLQSFFSEKHLHPLIALRKNGTFHHHN